ncbi:hypothetical protein FA95DRAFT_1610802 [Auriscalpium vulgare]|uniref:Uncharacterized protein n=1 Tax=Auriscalpium vulgare TaxID=40419 RepID=A0ACB8RCD7_9AGAM|nr:hypothetical protein FA95DRAFT_1610802 [Auriscalpium vulgare]
MTDAPAGVNTLWTTTASSWLAQLKPVPSLTTTAIYTTRQSPHDREELLERDLTTSLRQIETDLEALERVTHVLLERKALYNATYRRAMAALAPQHNSFAQISSLPPELMSIVFTFLCAMYPPAYLASHRCGDLRWIKVTHVCRRWRHIALNLPRLWERIDFLMGRWHVPHQRFPLIASIIPRTKSFHLFLLTIHMPLLKTLTAAAPIMDTLEVEIWTSSDFFGAHEIPDGIFGGDTPALRHVSIASVLPLQWSLPFLKNLTSLTMTQIPSMKFLASLTPIIGTLRKLATLISLDLTLPDLDIPAADAGEFLPRSHVQFPCLEYLRFATTVNDGTRFMRRLKIPPSVALHMDIGSSDEDLYDVSDFSRALSRLFWLNGKHCPPSLTKIVYSANSNLAQRLREAHDTVYLRLWTDVETHAHEPCMVLRFSRWEGSWDEFNLPESAVGDFPLTCLREAAIADSGWEAAEWEEVLEGVNDLRDIQAWGGAAAELCFTLSVPTGAAITQGPIPIPNDNRHGASLRWQT